PTAPDASVPDATNVAAPPARRFTVVDSGPFPLGAVQLDPAGVAHVHVTDVMAAGKGSTTVAPAMSLGPWFVTTIWYVAACPGIAGVVRILVPDRSAIAPSTVVGSSFLLLSGLGSGAVLSADAVLRSIVAVGDTRTRMPTWTTVPEARGP